MKNTNHSNTVLKSQGLPQFAIDELEKLKNTHVDKSTILKLENIDKVYDNGFQAIFGTSLSLEKGEFLALLGPSGCGKSTTLRVISGLEEASAGNIIIDNIDVTNIEPSYRNLTMVFQNYALFPHMSVKGNISFGLKANTKKLGEGGKIFSEIMVTKNLIKTLKKKISRINSIDKIAVHIQKLNEKFEKLQLKISTFDKVEMHEKIQEKLFNLTTLKHSLKQAIERSENILKVATEESNKIQEYNTELELLLNKLSELEMERKEAAKNDDITSIISEKVETAAKTLGLEYYLDRKPSELSGGQRQRVALGRSIVGNPSLFLMDEPLSNLDAKLRATMRRKIRELHLQVNSGTVYVTHDQIEAMTMSDKIAVMSDGFVMQIGIPNDIYSNPSCLFVATFVGTPTMNTYSGIIQQGKFISDEGINIDLYKEKLKNVTEGQRVVLGIRPTDLSTDDLIKQSHEGNATLNIKIKSFELLGNEYQYVGQIENTTEEIIFITSAYEKYAIDSNVKLHIMVSRVHLFDEKTTIALTSHFNYETLNSLMNWSLSGDKIERRRLILEKAKAKSQKLSLTQKLIKLVKSKIK